MVMEDGEDEGKEVEINLPFLAGLRRSAAGRFLHEGDVPHHVRQQVA